jgi:hypothetical protein
VQGAQLLILVSQVDASRGEVGDSLCDLQQLTALVRRMFFVRSAPAASTTAGDETA